MCHCRENRVELLSLQDITRSMAECMEICCCIYDSTKLIPSLCSLEEIKR